jgi:hypothetical protein
METVEQVFVPAAQERAFGASGESGDAAAIRHLAHRVLSVYEEILDVTSEVRSVDPPDLLKRMFQIAPRYMDAPIAQFRRFFATAIDEIERLPEQASEVAEPRTIMLDLVLSTDTAVQRELEIETKRVKRRVRWVGWTGGDLNSRSD